MAKSSIIVNKLILSLHGSDYALTDIQAPIIYSDYVTAWENAFLSAASTVEYAYTVKRYQNSESDHIAYNTLQSIAQTGNLDLLPYCKSLSNGEEFYIWREDVGRGIRIVIRNVNGAYTVLAYVYGTYTNMNGFPNTGVGESGNADITPTSKAGFAFDSDSGKYVFYIQTCANESNLVKPAYYAGITYQGVLFPSAIMASVLYVLLNGNAPTPPTPSTDPYADGGYSDTMEGSTGDFDDTSDTIAEPTAPALSAVDSGLITLYGVDRTNIRAFAFYLFGSSFDPANFHKLFESPMEAILCLNYMPYTPSSAAATPTEISFGAAGTGANGRVIGNQYETIDCGTLDLKEFYGSCLDYSPYTTVTLVLPYASAVDIDPDEFNTKTIGIKYRIDNYTGAGLVLISDGTSVLMQIPCTVANPLPISASNYSSIVSAIANTAIVSAGAILAVATGGVGTGAAIALAGGVAASTAGNVMSAKLHYNHGGAGGMGTGMFGIQKPYLIIKRPRQCLPDGNNSFQGYPTFCTKNLGNVSGFTKVFQIHLDNIPATDAEKKELETILKGGVWF